MKHGTLNLNLNLIKTSVTKLAKRLRIGIITSAMIITSASAVEFNPPFYLSLYDD